MFWQIDLLTSKTTDKGSHAPSVLGRALGPNGGHISSTVLVHVNLIREVGVIPNIWPIPLHALIAPRRAGLAARRPIPWHHTITNLQARKVSQKVNRFYMDGVWQGGTICPKFSEYHSEACGRRACKVKTEKMREYQLPMLFDRSIKVSGSQLSQQHGGNWMTSYDNNVLIGQEPPQCSSWNVRLISFHIQLKPDRLGLLR